MAGKDHGEMLTKFEEIFGTAVEHEVIKLILQSCEWDATASTDTLLAMVDKTKLAPHILSGLTADSIARSCFNNNNVRPIPVVPADPIRPTEPVIVYPPEPSSTHNVAVAEPALSEWALAPEFVPSESKNVRQATSVSTQAEAVWPSTTHTSTWSSPTHTPVWPSPTHTPTPVVRSGHQPSKPPHQGKPRQSKKEEIMTKILEGRRLLVVMRGLPGSGKTTMAKELKGKLNQFSKHNSLIQGNRGVILSSDDYFCDKRGRYKYDPTRIGAAHEWNKHRALQRLEEGKTPIIIDNTNLQLWEFKPYVVLALQYNYEIEILEADTWWRMKPTELSKQNIHGVPKSKIVLMKQKYQVGLTVEDVMAAIKGEPSAEGNLRTSIRGLEDIGKQECNGRKSEWRNVKDNCNEYRQAPGSGADYTHTNGEMPSSLSQIEYNYKNSTTSSSDDDADVVVEGYEDGRASRSSNEESIINKVLERYNSPKMLQRCNSGASSTGSSDTENDHSTRGADSSEGKSSPCLLSASSEEKIDLQSCLTSLAQLTMEVKATETQPSDIPSVSPVSYPAAEESAITEEDSLQQLCEASHDDIFESDSEWDNLTIEAEREVGDVNDEKFNDLVNSFGSALKLQVEGKSTGMADFNSSHLISLAPDTHEEDSVMDEFLRNLEKKTGKSMSVLVNEEQVETHDIPPCQNHSIPISLSSFSILDLPEAATVNSEGNSKQALGAADALLSPRRDTQSPQEGPVCENKESPVHVSSSIRSATSEDIQQEMSTIKLSFQSQNDTKLHTLDHETADSSPASANASDNDVFLKPEEKCEPNTEYECTDSVSSSNHVSPDGVSSSNHVSPIMSPRVSPVSHLQVDSLASWESVDINAGVSSMNWDGVSNQKTELPSSDCPKPSRGRARVPADLKKWLQEEEENKETEDPQVASWNAVEIGSSTSWEDQATPKSTSVSRDVDTSFSPEDLQPHTGAVSKLSRRSKKHVNNLSDDSTTSERSPEAACDTASKSPPGLSKNHLEQTSSPPGFSNIHMGQTSSPPGFSKNHMGQTSPPGFSRSPLRQTPSPMLVTCCAETQTLSMDFEALQLDNNLYELKVMYGRPNYVPKSTTDSFLLDEGPLTTGKLRLEKGTMTDNPEEVTIVKPFWNLVAFFPNIPEDELRDVFEKCKYDLDWAMNVLLDGGYEMSDPSEAKSKIEKMQARENQDNESTTETTSTGDGRCDQSFADVSDASSDLMSEERTRRLKQSQLSQNLAAKKEIEETFTFPASVDDRITRLTGKETKDLNLTKVKKTKKKSGGRKSISPKHEKSGDSSETEEGAQYITLVMDPLFASQLSRMFGAVAGSCGELGGEMAPEDRSVILPLELCHSIHQFWNRTSDSKFRHEAQVLDSLIREDECLARRLQEEENANAKKSSSSGRNSREGFEHDPPTQFREIMDLEQALQQSQGEVGDNREEQNSISSRLNLQRLYSEYPHVDRTALKEEFTTSGQNYQATVERLTERYGTEQGTPKTVMAPEALYRYEIQMIEEAQRLSLAQQQQEEQDRACEAHETIEAAADDPQIYRDEAQLHYNQRQEFFKKAQDASRQGMKAVAAYYARIGNLHAAKLTEANHRASEKILEATNSSRRDANCLDLHLLHIPEAISATHAFLNERQRVLVARGAKQMQVSLITGRGVHSIGGQAKLKPSIKDYLHKSGYRFHEANAGMFVVTLQV